MIMLIRKSDFLSRKKSANDANDNRDICFTADRWSTTVIPNGGLRLWGRFFPIWRLVTTETDKE